MWVFYIEHFAGSLQAAVKSRVHPWSNLSRRNLHLAYLAQLTVKYNLQDELMLVGTGFNDKLARGETSYHNCAYAHIFRISDTDAQRCIPQIWIKSCNHLTFGNTLWTKPSRRELVHTSHQFWADDGLK